MHLLRSCLPLATFSQTPRQHCEVMFLFNQLADRIWHRPIDSVIHEGGVLDLASLSTPVKIDELDLKAIGTITPSKIGVS